MSCLIFLLINILYCLFFFSVPFLQRTPQPSWEGLAAAFSLWTAEHLKPLKKKKKKIESFWCLFVFFWFSLFFFLLPLSLRLSSATVLVSLSTRSVATWMSLWWVSVLGSSKFPWTHCNKKVPSLYFCFFHHLSVLSSNPIMHPCFFPSSLLSLHTSFLPSFHPSAFPSVLHCFLLSVLTFITFLCPFAPHTHNLHLTYILPFIFTSFLPWIHICFYPSSFASFLPPATLPKKANLS